MAYNSTIQKKHCKCSPDCDKWPTMSCFGYFYAHLPEDLAKKAGTRRKVAIKNRNRRIAIAHKIKVVQKQVDGSDYSELWFAIVANEIRKNPYCWETGEYISEDDYRNASAHIFPKSIFKSVATHPLNFLILSPRNGSHDKTHRLDTFSKMKVFKMAVERFKIFEPYITEKHKYLDLFKQYASPYIPLNDIDI